MISQRCQRVLAVLPALSLLALLAAGCGGDPKSSSGGQVVARVGRLEIIHPFLPDPANPSVAAVYLTIRDTGDESDRLVSATTPLTQKAILMREDEHGNMDSMAPMEGLAIPAHGEGALTPGHDHLMLENLKHDFKVGQHILVTLRFEHAGSVTIRVPVVPLSDIVGGGSGGMKGMKGMAGM